MEWQIELKRGLGLDTCEEIAEVVEERINNKDGVSKMNSPNPRFKWLISELIVSGALCLGWQSQRSTRAGHDSRCDLPGRNPRTAV